MKPYTWSNGEKVTAQDVIFWMNMMKVEKLNWAGYAAGTIPDDLADVTASGDTVTFHLNTSANSNWYTYNELSQITPMPMAWDVTKAGQKPQLCGTAPYSQVTVSTKNSSSGTTVTPVSAAAKSCAAVYNFLTGEAKKLSTYDSNPLWQVVDGPFKLTHFDTTRQRDDGAEQVLFGPRQAEALEVRRAARSRPTTAEFNALAAGKVDVGYPALRQDITSNADDDRHVRHQAGSEQPAALRELQRSYAGNAWQINYFPFNFNSTR